MSIKFIDDLVFDIYIKKELISDINFNNKNELEGYLKKLFKILKNKYNIKIEGFYNINVYIDKYYGVIFNIEKEDLEYYNYIKNQVDMKVVTIDTEILYLVDDIPFEIINKININIKNNNILIKLKQELTNLEMMRLLEFSKVVYK